MGQEQENRLCWQRRVGWRLQIGGTSPVARLVAMLGHVDDDGLFPAEQEVAEGGTENNRQAEPRVVRHEDQHQQEAQRDLQDVQYRLV